MSEPAPAAPALPVRWRLLTILTASYGAGAFGMLGISPLSPSLVEGLGLTRFQVAFLVPSIYLSGLLFSLPGGRLADRLGVRPSFLGGLAVAAIGLLAAALAPGFLAFLVCLFVAGSGWSVVNPALGKAIMDVFPVSERGIAMGVKQMGLTLGGLVAALALPAIAATLGWRYAVGACSVIVAVPVALGWRPLAAFHAGARGAASTGGADDAASSWWWARRPALVIFFATGFVLGMVQGAVLSYLPLFTIQALGFDKIGAGLLVAASQAGGAVSRLVLGAASDRWAAGRRSLWLAFTGAVGAVIFCVYAVWPATSAGMARAARLRHRRRRLRLGRHLLRDQRGSGRPGPGRAAERRGLRRDRARPPRRPTHLRPPAGGLRLLRRRLGGLRRPLRPRRPDLPPRRPRHRPRRLGVRS